jgi:hypothetical protein
MVPVSAYVSAALEEFCRSGDFMTGTFYYITLSVFCFTFVSLQKKSYFLVLFKKTSENSMACRLLVKNVKKRTYYSTIVYYRSSFVLVKRSVIFERSVYFCISNLIIVFLRNSHFVKML